MKKVLVSSILCALFFMACSPKVTQTTTANANNAEGEAIKVSGACNMCKKRIETAVYGLAGIKKATWSAASQSLVVSYNAKKTSNEAIQKRIAAMGHDTEKFKAEEKTYNELPECCHYREVSAH
jgi:Cu(I)/Ag(I) efflux system membrane fusion protein